MSQVLHEFSVMVHIDAVSLVRREVAGNYSFHLLWPGSWQAVPSTD